MELSKCSKFDGWISLWWEYLTSALFATRAMNVNLLLHEKGIKSCLRLYTIAFNTTFCALMRINRGIWALPTKTFWHSKAFTRISVIEQKRTRLCWLACHVYKVIWRIICSFQIHIIYHSFCDKNRALFDSPWTRVKSILNRQIHEFPIFSRLNDNR